MQIQVIQNRIFEIRGQQVMFDYHLAELYEVETKVLNQSVKRNIARFPSDFMFKITKDEHEFLRSQFVTLEKGRGKHPKYPPHVFTEQGVAMLSGVLSSEKAIRTHVAIIRAFAAIRKLALDYSGLQQKIEELEKKYDKHFTDVFQVLDFLVAKKKIEESAKREPIGFIRPHSSKSENKLKTKNRKTG